MRDELFRRWRRREYGWRVDTQRLRALLDAGRSLAAELDPDALLSMLLDAARELTGARYAAIGVLSPGGDELERFITAGIDPASHAAIGDLPRGRGVLGVLIDDPKALRLSDVGRHALSYGFPAGHPEMHSFLGVPVLVRGEPWGNLYLTEKQGGDFTPEDEEAITVLADFAAVAVVNARLFGSESARRTELERANAVLETTTDLSRALGGVVDVDRALELVVKRSRALLDARLVELAVIDGDHVVIAAGAGEGVEEFAGRRMPLEGSIAANVVRTGRAQRFEEIPKSAFARRELGARRAMVTPLTFRRRTIGILVVLDRTTGDAPFTADEQRLLEAFAASAATVLATAQQATDEARRRSFSASEEERRRWARELHDETLQEMAALRVMLSSARRAEDPARWRATLDDASELLGGAIHNLRSLITDLRPAALDDLGLAAALEALTERLQRQYALKIEFDHETAGGLRLDGELEAAAYRLVQEALNNVGKHARAGRAQVTLRVDDAVNLEIRDDGRGFDFANAERGFGLHGMEERVAALQGTIDVTSATGSGTTVSVRLPLHRVQPLAQVG